MFHHNKGQRDGTRKEWKVKTSFHFIFIFNFLGIVAPQLEKTALQGAMHLNTLKTKSNILHLMNTIKKLVKASSFIPCAISSVLAGIFLVLALLLIQSAAHSKDWPL